MRILSYSHVASDPTGGAASATLLMNQALRDRGNEVHEYFDGQFGPHRGLGRIGKELAAVALVRHVRPRLDDYDVLEVTGPLGWVVFPMLRALRRDRLPVLVARSYGLEHNDHRIRLEESREGRLRLSVAYRIGGGFLTLREVEVAIAASHLFAASRPAAAEWAVNRRLKDVSSCVVAGFGVENEYLAAECRPDGQRVAWIGTPIERKGWRYFVEGFSAAAGEDPALNADLFGTRGRPGDIVRFFPVALRDRIHVHPILDRSDLIRLLCRCSTLVSTSLSEGYHLAVLQAMAAGVPVIATREGFLADISPSEPPLFREIVKRSSSSVQAALQELSDPATSPSRTDRAARAKAHAAGRSWEKVSRLSEAAYARQIADRKINVDDRGN